MWISRDFLLCPVWIFGRNVRYLLRQGSFNGSKLFMPFTINIKTFSTRWWWEDIPNSWIFRVSTGHHVEKLPTTQTSQAHVSRKSKRHQSMKASYILWPGVKFWGELIICFFWWRELEISLPTAASKLFNFSEKDMEFYVSNSKYTKAYWSKPYIRFVSFSFHFHHDLFFISSFI